MLPTDYFTKKIVKFLEFDIVKQTNKQTNKQTKRGQERNEQTIELRVLEKQNIDELVMKTKRRK
jgi:hypothetical protein